MIHYFLWYITGIGIAQTLCSFEHVSCLYYDYRSQA